MFFTLGLLYGCIGLASQSVSWFSMCVLLLLYGRISSSMISNRLAYLTKDPPKIPIGELRRVRIESKEEKFHGYYYRDMYWFVLSLFIVPYESMVIFMDELYDPSLKAGFVSTPQERTHALVHSKYNKSLLNIAYMDNPMNRLLFGFVTAFYHYSTLFFKTYFPDVVSTLIVYTESRFYYEFTIDSLFDEFSLSDVRSPILNKIYLWHFYEELEHHMETTYLFGKRYGNKKYWMLIVALPLYSFLVYTIHIFALIATLVNFSKVHMLAPFQNIYPFIYDLIFLDISIVWNLFLIMGDLSSKYEKIDADLLKFRTKYYQKYNIQLKAESAGVKPSFTL